MPFRDSLVFWIVVALLPSFVVGMAVNAKLNQHPQLRGRDAWSKALVWFCLPAMVCLAWSAAFFRVGYEAAGIWSEGLLLPVVIMSLEISLVVIAVGVLILPTCRKICHWFEKVDQWFYTKFP